MKLNSKSKIQDSKQNKTRVVNLIPTYNEAENVLLMLKALNGVAGDNPQYEWMTLVVDDNSPDGTGEKVRSQRSEISRQKLFLLEGKKEGLGVALMRGYRYAMEKLKADVVVSNDCDFQFDPKDIPRLLEKIEEGFDVVIASRHTKGGDVEGWPVGRRLTHWVANTIFASWVAGTKEVTDHNGNFRAVRVKGVLNQIDWVQVNTRGYGFLNYMVYLLGKTGARFTEVPVVFKWRERGETKVSFTPKYFKTFFYDTIEYIRTCLWIRWGRTQDKVLNIRNKQTVLTK